MLESSYNPSEHTDILVHIHKNTPLPPSSLSSPLLYLLLPSFASLRDPEHTTILLFKGTYNTPFPFQSPPSLPTSQTHLVMSCETLIENTNKNSL